MPLQNHNTTEHWLVFSRGRILPTPGKGYLWHALPEVGQLVQQHWLGQPGGDAIYAVECDLPESLQANTVPIRQAVFDDIVEGYRLHQAASLINWGRTNRFCSRCGTPLPSVRQQALLTEGRARTCTKCQHRFYPAVSPCVIVLIHKGDQLLLAQGRRQASGYYSLVAGFIEPGEDVEQAVAREVFEEIGLLVNNICYQSSQPWPFDHNLMMGFTASYAGGELRIAPDELRDAGWFSVNALPPLPPKQTIARQLIESFIINHTAEFGLEGRGQ